MGNCVAGSKVLGQELGEQCIRIMRPDGKILEFESPILVKDLLSDNRYRGHAVVYPLAAYSALSPDRELVPGELYYLLPWQTAGKCPNSGTEVPSGVNGEGEYADNTTSVSTETKDQAPSRESLPRKVSAAQTGGVRLKVVITKEQLMALLAKDSIDKVQSLEDLVVQLQMKAKSVMAERRDSSTRMGNCGWRPALESIAEGGDDALSTQLQS